MNSFEIFVKFLKTVQIFEILESDVRSESRVDNSSVKWCNFFYYLKVLPDLNTFKPKLKETFE